MLGTTLTVPNDGSGLDGTYTEAATYNIDGGIASNTRPTISGIAAVRVGYGYNAIGLPLTQNAGPYSIASTTSYSAYGEATATTGGAANQQIFLNRSFEDGTRRLARQFTRAQRAPAISPTPPTRTTP